MLAMTKLHWACPVCLILGVLLGIALGGPRDSEPLESRQPPDGPQEMKLTVPPESLVFGLATITSDSLNYQRVELHELEGGPDIFMDDEPSFTHEVLLGKGYAQHYNLDNPQPTPIGVNCYLCERQYCRQRAHAPLNKALNFDERAKGMSLFNFHDDEK